jgi:cobalt-zinc-cadmium efflux system protein
VGGHGRHHGRAAGGRLWAVLAITAAYMIAEAVAGLVAGSLALLSDAGHMLSDVGALSLSAAAAWLVSRPPNARRTYGYHRAEILAALANGATLVAITIWIFVEAARRLASPPEVRGAIVIWIAAVGGLVNLAGLALLHRHRHESLNVHGAWLHIFTDLLGSIGALASGVLIWALGWMWADPLASVLIGGLVLYSAWGLVARSVSVLMESTPGGIDVDEIEAAIGAVEGVRGVHDLHLWTITTGMDALSAHVVAEAAHDGAVLRAVRRVLHERFGIDHITIQVEPPGFVEERPGV